jgi:hypothetical protein
VKRRIRRRREFRSRWRLLPNPSATQPVSTRIFSRSKLGEDESTNADYADVSSDLRRLTVADGISRSFRPRDWARHLVAQANQMEPTQIIGSLDSIVSSFDPGNLDDVSWPEAALRDRFGSQATFISAALTPRDDGSIDVTVVAVGDCVLAVVEGENSLRRVITWPFATSPEFPSVPGNVCTALPYLRGDLFGPRHFVLRSGLRLLVMSDAMGRAMLAGIEAQRAIDEIFPFLFTETDFHEWSTDAMRNGKVEEDDLTIVEVRYT